MTDTDLVLAQQSQCYLSANQRSETSGYSRQGAPEHELCLCTISERIEGDKDRAGVRIIKSLDELDTSGLSTARGSNLCRKVNKPFPDMLTSHMEGHWKIMKEWNIEGEKDRTHQCHCGAWGNVQVQSADDKVHQHWECRSEMILRSLDWAK